jgi:hypothetical protein
MTRSSVDTVLSQLGKLSLQDLQTVIQTASSISKDLNTKTLVESSPLMDSLTKELDELEEFEVDIPVQLQFRLQGSITYRGPSRDFEYDEVSIKNTGKSPFRADNLIDGEGMLDSLVGDLNTVVPRSLRPKTEKACPQLAAYLAKIDSFEDKLQKAANEIDMTRFHLYDLLTGVD